MWKGNLNTGKSMGKSRFIAVCMENNIIISNTGKHCILHTHNCKPTFAPPLCIAGHTFYVTGIHCCHCSVTAAIENLSVRGCGCFPIKLCWQKQGLGQIWPTGHNVLIPGIEYFWSYFPPDRWYVLLYFILNNFLNFNYHHCSV